MYYEDIGCKQYYVHMRRMILAMQEGAPSSTLKLANEHKKDASNPPHSTCQASQWECVNPISGKPTLSIIAKRLRKNVSYTTKWFCFLGCRFCGLEYVLGSVDLYPIGSDAPSNDAAKFITVISSLQCSATALSGKMRSVVRVEKGKSKLFS